MYLFQIKVVGSMNTRNISQKSSCSSLHRLVQFGAHCSATHLQIILTMKGEVIASEDQAEEVYDRIVEGFHPKGSEFFQN